MLNAAVNIKYLAINEIQKCLAENLMTFLVVNRQKLAISNLKLHKCIQLHIKILPSGFNVSELIKK